MFEIIGQITVAAVVIGAIWFVFNKGWLDTPLAWALRKIGLRA